ncbi:Nuclear transcription factor Y subunit C-1 [Glycine soja]|nr:Nuclear transcription factor Y subunit C-1 [Glycine soja]
MENNQQQGAQAQSGPYPGGAGGSAGAGAGAGAAPFQHLLQQQQQQLQMFWSYQRQEIEHVNDFKNHQLPLARIKKIMKADEDVRMISAEAPILFAKACELFILELTIRSWLHADENKRRTLQKNDIAAAITRTDIFDFLVDIVPRDEIKDDAALVGATASGVPYYYPPIGQPAGMMIGRPAVDPATGVYVQPPSQAWQSVWQSAAEDTPYGTGAQGNLDGQSEVYKTLALQLLWFGALKALINWGLVHSHPAWWPLARAAKHGGMLDPIARWLTKSKHHMLLDTTPSMKAHHSKGKMLQRNIAEIIGPPIGGGAIDLSLLRSYRDHCVRHVWIHQERPEVKLVSLDAQVLLYPTGQDPPDVLSRKFDKDRGFCNDKHSTIFANKSSTRIHVSYLQYLDNLDGCHEIFHPYVIPSKEGQPLGGPVHLVSIRVQPQPGHPLTNYVPGENYSCQIALETMQGLLDLRAVPEGTSHHQLIKQALELDAA